MPNFAGYSQFNNTPPAISGFPGFTPPPGAPQLLIGRDVYGRPVIISDGSVPYDPNASYEADISLLRNMIANHDWYYKYRDNQGSYMRGFHNEQQIEDLVRRHGGVFETIWQTEKNRHTSGMTI